MQPSLFVMGTGDASEGGRTDCRAGCPERQSGKEGSEVVEEPDDVGEVEPGVAVVIERRHRSDRFTN
jgi:hypothetical protein